MPTLVACLSARNHADQPYRVPTCLAARKTIRGPKGQGNQQLISTASAQTCPLTANSGPTFPARSLGYLVLLVIYENAVHAPVVFLHLGKRCWMVNGLRR